MHAESAPSGFSVGASSAPPGDSQPLPLRGPLGLRELFCRASSDPILARVPRKRWRWLIAAALALLPAPIYWAILQGTQSPQQAEASLAVFMIPAAFASEGLFFFLGAIAGEAAARRLRLQLKLPELVLTEIRPLAIGQMALKPALEFLTAGVAVCVLLPGFLIMLTHPSLLGFMIVFAVLALNALLAVHAAAWAAFSVSLAQKNLFQTIWALANLAPIMVLPVGFAAVFGVGLGVGYNSAVSYPGPWHMPPQRIAVLVALYLAPIGCAVKLLVMRAYAVRLETVVLPRMEH